ncbi:MAG: hypothetical protein PXY39_06055, partial [archaeon]|nr:hypothetical protein [archaeon]
GLQMYQVDPSGTYFKGSGFAIGAGSERSLEVIQRGYRPNMSLEELISLGTSAIKTVTQDESQIEFGVVSNATSKFEKLMSPLPTVR